VGLSKKFISLHSGMLEPWIMAHNPWKKIALFYTRNHQKELIFMRLPNGADNIKALGLIIPYYNS
jgi:hypothetical protein